MIDEADRPLVESRLWSARINGNVWYAQTGVIVNGRRTVEEMHRVLMGRRPGMEIDHIDGDGLNNRRANLRFATHQENVQNQRAHRDSASGFKGVHFHPSSGLWMVRIALSGESQLLGYFKDAAEAAAAYDVAAREAFGGFARLNFPRAGEQPALPRKGA